MTVSATLGGVFLKGTAASRPAANAVAGGTVYSATDTGVITQSDGSSWSTWATISSGLADPMTTRGDIMVRNASNVTARLGIGASGKVLTSDGTDVSWQTPSGTASACSVTKSASQATSSNPTTITWDQEDEDTDGYHDNVTNNSRLTIPTGKGGVLFLVNAVVEHNAGTSTPTLQLWKNGSTLIDGGYYGTNVYLSRISLVVKLADADYLELKINGVTSGSVINTDWPARFSIVRQG